MIHTQPQTRRTNAEGHIEVLCCPVGHSICECGTDIFGCGSHRLHWDAPDGTFDCLDCGIWFEPSEGEWRPLLSYHFDAGDSSKKGGIGLCARVDATSKEGAVKILNGALAEETQLLKMLCLSRDRDSIEYINLYTACDGFTEANIDITEPVEEEVHT